MENDLAMERRRQYTADLSNDKTTASGQLTCSDANVAPKRDPLKDVHGSRFNGNTVGATKPRIWKDKGYPRPKAIQGLIAKPSSLKTPLEKTTDNQDDELDAIENRLNGIWENDGM